MGNSPLVNYTRISPNKTSPRNHKIDTITIHCVVGQCTVESLGAVFAPVARQASSNYGVGYDGRIGLYVDEKDRSWCSSSAANDNRAITIEVASDTYAPYKVTPEAYNALIKLCADICKRNGIKKLLWKGDKSLIGQVDKQNMTAHRWFAATACPGEYLYTRFGDIAKKVNDILNPKPAPSTTLAVGDKVKMSANAVVYGTSTKFASFVYNSTLYVREITEGDPNRIVVSTQQTGAITGAVDKKYLTKISSAPATKPVTLKKGDKIQITSNAVVYGTNTPFAPWVYGTVYKITGITENGNRIAFATLDGVTVGATDKKYIQKV